MLKRFSVKNYKNFRNEICIDFEKTAGYQFSSDCITNDVIHKMLIYGRNATGKTNLGKAIMDIRYIVVDMATIRKGGVLINADSTEETALFTYVFQFEDQEVVYQYARFSDQRLCNEILTVDGEVIYQCDFHTKRNMFRNLERIGVETANVDRYLQALDAEGESKEPEREFPFLRWLVNNVVIDKKSIVIALYDYIRKMTLVAAGSSDMFQSGWMNASFYESLERPENLKDFEDFLNAMGMEYKLVLRTLPDGQRELYFAHNKLVPFYENASSGTRILVGLYRNIVSRVQAASFIYLDEFDAFYHYEMAENVMKFFKKRYPASQIIMTTHNTNLMTNRLMRPDCVFILSGRGTLTALCDATERELREGHNLEKMYVSGEFERYE